MKLSELMVAALVLTASSTAYAHIRVESHKTRLTSSDQKTGPCGRANSKRNAANVQTFKSGETITLKVNEYIPHPGWFRVSFDQDGDDDFVAPKSIDPPSFDDNDAVLMDKLDMHQTGLGGMRTWEVKLPDVECDNCTLQVIQVMLDKPPYDPQDNGALSNDIYYACIDMVLKREGGGTSTGDAGKEVDSTSNSSDAGTSAARDAGATSKPDTDEDVSEKPPEAAAGSRDAGRTSGGSSSATTSPAKDAGVSHADHEEEESDHDDEDAEEGDDGRDDSTSSTASGEEGGCALGSGASRDAWPIGFWIAGILFSRLRRRRHASQ